MTLLSENKGGQEGRKPAGPPSAGSAGDISALPAMSPLCSRDKVPSSVSSRLHLQALQLHRELGVAYSSPKKVAVPFRSERDAVAAERVNQWCWLDQKVTGNPLQLLPSWIPIPQITFTNSLLPRSSLSSTWDWINTSYTKQAIIANEHASSGPSETKGCGGGGGR